MVLAERGKSITTQLARDLVAKHKPAKEEPIITMIEVSRMIRAAIASVYEKSPEKFFSLIGSQFRALLDEHERGMISNGD